jgi:hypothetical protein
MRYPILIGLLAAGLAFPAFSQQTPTGYRAPVSNPAPVNAPTRSIVGNRMLGDSDNSVTFSNGRVIDNSAPKPVELLYCDDPKIALDTSGVQPACKQRGVVPEAPTPVPAAPQLRNDRGMRSDKDMFNSKKY